MKTIEERIYDIVAGVSQKPNQPTASLAELGCDSLDILDIEFQLEKEFDITITDEAADITTDQRVNMSMSAHDIVTMVEYRHLNVKPYEE